MRKVFCHLLMLSAVLLSSLLLVSCNGLTQYTLTEQRINQQLQQRVNFSKNIGLTGIADASITLGALHSQIGREEPGKIILTGQATVMLTSLFGDQQAALPFILKTQPVFDKQQGAIYLRDLQLAPGQVIPEKLTTVVKVLLPYFNQALTVYFDQHPAYVLDASHSKAEALAKRYAKGIEVKPGEIVIPFIL